VVKDNTVLIGSLSVARATAVAIYVKEYFARENDSVIDRHYHTDILERSGAWKLRISRASPHPKPITF
jgi:hypothetical protein